MIAVILLLALAVVFSFLAVALRNIIYGVIFLLCSNVTLGILYYMVGAPLVALFQLAIFAGAIVVFFVITIMLTKAGVMEASEEESNIE
ncbi:NADH-quinone oxidoreductase subunit J [Candidatus Bathyarchaeota archaeon]|nr:NADH-quinone oxidoreductase subunit J [Candidatus Bathyarchaeota archaeon]MBS7630021.1 NADH-quinone oxidoreductase subunit J [Candidatus Bathyarchaeota archaeon]